MNPLYFYYFDLMVSTFPRQSSPIYLLATVLRTIPSYKGNIYIIDLMTYNVKFITHD